MGGYRVIIKEMYDVTIEIEDARNIMDAVEQAKIRYIEQQPPATYAKTLSDESWLIIPSKPK